MCSRGYALWWLLALTLGLVACDPARDQASAARPIEPRVSEVNRARLQGMTLVIHRVEAGAPEGTDGQGRVDVGLVEPTGRVRTLSLGVPVVEAVVWNGAIAALDPDGVLWRAELDGRRDEIARHVAGDLGVSPDGLALAWSVVPDLLGEVRVRRGGDEVAVATGLASSGLFRFSNDGNTLAFVASRPGGVVGVWVADAGSDASARCLTNCTLRTGESWGDAFAPIPGRAADLDVTSERVRWTSESGRALIVHLQTGRTP